VEPYYSAKQIGGYAWSIYGLLIMANMRYYYDLYYRTYIMSPYGENGRGVAFKDIWGVAAFMRIAVHMAAWSIAGLFWIWCFLPYAYPWVLFSHVTLGLAIVELSRIVFVIILECFALMLDKYDSKYGIYNNWLEQGGWGPYLEAKGKDHFDMRN
jgi:hypothetical protein